MKVYQNTFFIKREKMNYGRKYRYRVPPQGTKKPNCGKCREEKGWKEVEKRGERTNRGKEKERRGR